MIEVENTLDQEEEEITALEEEQDIKEQSGEREVLQHATHQYRVGEIVTFTFSHFDKFGLPVRPRLQRKRTDVTWQDVVENYKQGKPVKKALLGTNYYLSPSLSLTIN